MVFIYSHYVNNTVTMLIMTTVGLREQHVKHYCVIHFCISIISYLSATLWDCVAPFENILVESNVSILCCRAAGAACEALLCYYHILLITFLQVILPFSYLSATVDERTRCIRGFYLQSLC